MGFTDKNKKTIIQQQFFETAVALSFLEFSRGVTCISDGIMTSRLVGTEELAAFGIVAPYYSIVAIISIFLTIGCQSMYTQNLGKGNLDRANAYFSFAVLYGGIISLAMTVLGIIMAEPLCSLFGARGASGLLMPYAKEYLTGLLTGTIGNVMLGILTPIVELDGGGLWTKTADVAMIVVNIAGNYIATGILGLGLLGIGISSSLSFFVAVIIISMHFFSKRCQIRFLLGKENRVKMGELIGIGYPGAVSMLCRAICPVIVNSMIIAVAASEGLSAVSAQANIKFMIGAPLCGIAGAVMELGGISYGERDAASLKEILVLSVRYIFTGVVFLAMIVFLLAPLFSSCYFSRGDEIYALAANAIRIYALSLPFCAFNLIVISYLQIINKKVPLLVMYVCNEMLSVAVCSIVFGKLFGFYGILASIAIGPALISIICVLKLLWEKNSRPGFKLPYLPDDFGVRDEDCLYAIAKSMDEVMEISWQVQSFCSKKGVDSKKAAFVALIIEELAGNAVKHGFNDGGRHQVDMRVVTENKNVILKISDNCKRFDYNKRIDSLRIDKSELDKNLGLKLALGLTQEITYVNTANKNILMMSF